MFFNSHPIIFEIWSLSFTPPKTKCSPLHVNEQDCHTSVFSPNTKWISRSAFPFELVTTGTWNELLVLKTNTSSTGQYGDGQLLHPSVSKDQDLRNVNISLKIFDLITGQSLWQGQELAQSINTSLHWKTHASSFFIRFSNKGVRTKFKKLWKNLCDCRWALTQTYLDAVNSSSKAIFQTFVGLWKITYKLNLDLLSSFPRQYLRALPWYFADR